MIINAQELSDGAVIESDVCIVGGGAAGVTIAREFMGTPYTVTVLESGGTEREPAYQELASGKSTGVSYAQFEYEPSHPKFANDRYLGGNSNRWASFCRPFDELDFEVRSWVPYSGWPFKKAALMPFYERAQVVCKLERPLNYDADVLSATIPDPVFRPLPLEGGEVTSQMWQFSPTGPVRFGQQHQAEFEGSSNVTLYLHANVTEIETNEANRAVTQLKVASIDGPKFTAKAKIFILAANGIENPRLLLVSNQQQPAGLGNEHDLVGRFFMEHPHLHRSGLMMMTDENYYPALYTLESRRTHNLMAAFCPSREFQEREEILNCSSMLDPSLDLWANSSMSNGFLGHITAVFADLANLPNNVLIKLGHKERPTERTAILDLTTRSEQCPNPNSRVTLIQEKDALGVNKVELNWQLTSLDKKTLLRSQEAIAKSLGMSNLGRMKIQMTDDLGASGDSWVPVEADGYLEGGWHHMGTTRMHINPKEGVVDANCRLHTVSNLYVAGSSVFPTGSYSNPMMTIIALALRLSDHVKEELATVAAPT